MRDKNTARMATALENIAGTQRDLTPRDTSRTQSLTLPLLGRIKASLLVSDANSARAVRRRRSTPIHAFVGPNGGGKSLAMVETTIPSLDAGRRVLSTVALLDSDTGLPHPCYEKFEDWEQLLDAEDCDVLMDEMVGIAGARESQKLPVQVQNILVQLRRRNLHLRWSAPAWGRADKIIREVSQAVTECRGFYSLATIERDDKGNEIEHWGQKRLFSFKTYDTINFEEWTAGKRDKAEAEFSEWFIGPGSRAFASYDTMDSVSRVGDVTDAGTCGYCGGVRRAKPCKCADHVEHVPLASVSIHPSSHLDSSHAVK